MPEVNLMSRAELANCESIPNGAKTVTPSDTDYIAHPSTRQQYVGRYVTCRAFRVLTTAGDVSVEFPDGSTYTFPAVAQYATVEVEFVRVRSTGTTAVGIEVYY